MDHVADYVAKLDKDTDFGAALLKKVEAAKEKYEELSVPAVKSVSAINANDVKQSLPATDVLANSKFEVNFSDAVDAATVTTGTVYLTQDGVKQLATVSYDSEKKVATVELSAGNTLAPGKSYVLTVDGVKDAKGVAVKKSTTSFTVSANPIITNATFTHGVTGTTNIEGAVVDTATEAITLTFNKNLDTNTLSTSNVKLYNITKEEYVAVSLSGITATSVTVAPSANLVADNDYRLEVGAGIADLAGNKLTATSYNFFYGITPVGVQNITPTNGATTVYNKITSSGGNDAFKYRAQFSAAVDASTVNGTTVKLVDKVTGSTVDATVSYEEGSRYVIVTPRADLAENNQYEVTIDGVKTAKGIKVTKSVTTFTTSDFTAPTIVSSTPANAADGVALDGTFTINFSEKMNAAKLVLGTDVILEDVSNNNTPVASFSNWTSTLSQDGKTLTVKPSASNKLDANKTYRLTVKKTAADVAANTLAADYKVLFNSEAAAATKLTKVQSGSAYSTTNTVRESGVTNIASANTTNFYFNFDQALKTDAGSYVLDDLVVVEKLNANGTYTAETDAAVVVSLVNSNKTIEVDKTAAWSADSTYRITIPTSVKDANGNDVQKVEFTFTTGTKPVVDTTVSSPANFATGVAVDEAYLAVVINDTESDLQSASLNADNVKVVKKSDGTAAPYSIDAINYATKATTTTAAVAALSNSDKTFEVADASKFTAGNIITFSTLAGTYVVTGVDTANNLVTVNKAVTGLGNTETVTFNQGVVYKLNTGAKLATNSEYDVKVENVKDAAGNIADAKTFTFRTGTAATDLALDSSSVTDGQTGVAVNAPLTLTFNTPVDASTVTAANITVEKDGTPLATNGSAYTVEVDSADSKKIVIKPVGFLSADAVYKVTVTTNVKNTAAYGADALDSAKSISFRTEQTASVSPKLVTAKLLDANNNGIGDTGEKVLLTFNAPVTAGTVDEADFLFANGGSIGNATATASGTESAIITLGTTSTLVKGLTTIEVTGTDLKSNGVDIKGKVTAE
nr:Ig-like domain-containing protein [Cytobacillus firmus]